MTIDEAIKILEAHNQWRRGDETSMEHPVKIGMAIDKVVSELQYIFAQFPFLKDTEYEI